MKKQLLLVFLVFSLCNVALVFGGVKGGRNQVKGSMRVNSTHPGVNDTGLCHIRIPYEHWVVLNRTNATGPTASPPPVDTRPIGSRPWVTIIDCCEGFVRNKTTKACEAYCEQGCVGGRCVGANVCVCEDGWSVDSAGVCKPVCSRGCKPKSYCFAPEQCICELGYAEVEDECRPICPGGCKNGDCIAPRLCRCKPGFVLHDQRECIPVCEGGCPHGECTAPGVCTCYPGYVNPPQETEACLPDCPGGCGEGECTSPGVCTCRSGLIRNSAGKCVSDCATGCPNGRCIGDNQCACDPGYILDAQTGECVGTCDRPCMNGRCTGANTCACNKGYVLDAQDPTRSRCVARCSGGCPNGVCSGPNFCICNPGYVKDRSIKGRQVCVPRT